MWLRRWGYCHVTERLQVRSPVCEHLTPHPSVHRRHPTDASVSRGCFSCSPPLSLKTVKKMCLGEDEKEGDKGLEVALVGLIFGFCLVLGTLAFPVAEGCSSKEAAAAGRGGHWTLPACRCCLLPGECRVGFHHLPSQGLTLLWALLGAC